MKTLVLFYSLTGKTRLVAKAMAQAMDADILEIKEVKPRSTGFLTYLAGGFAARTDKASKIEPIDVNLKQYDIVFIGSPVWASRPVPAVNSFIYSASFSGQSIVPFFTLGGDNSDPAFKNTAAKIENSQGKVTGHFAVTTYKLSDEEILIRARNAIENYSNSPSH